MFFSYQQYKLSLNDVTCHEILNDTISITHYTFIYVHTLTSVFVLLIHKTTNYALSR